MLFRIQLTIITCGRGSQNVLSPSVTISLYMYKELLVEYPQQTPTYITFALRF